MKLPTQTAPIHKNAGIVAHASSVVTAEVQASLDLKPMCIATCKALPEPLQAGCLQACNLLR
jgi:hypothetical protein